MLNRIRRFFTNTFRGELRYLPMPTAQTRSYTRRRPDQNNNDREYIAGISEDMLNSSRSSTMLLNENSEDADRVRCRSSSEGTIYENQEIIDQQGWALPTFDLPGDVSIESVVSDPGTKVCGVMLNEARSQSAQDYVR